MLYWRRFLKLPWGGYFIILALADAALAARAHHVLRPEGTIRFEVNLKRAEKRSLLQVAQNRVSVGVDFRELLRLDANVINLARNGLTAAEGEEVIAPQAKEQLVVNEQENEHNESKFHRHFKNTLYFYVFFSSSHLA